ncbi:SRPBCC family protein [Aggregatilinea lenta]|uniref:SRPBCC family protein n=1 Tax=Aggregatilinea lenta TaxID=913108 RepID=UPI0013C338B3|nr:SRPBCC family protein [Aggregatilinea lenta]
MQPTSDNETSIRRAVTVHVPPVHAFRAFTQGMGSWWPSKYTWAQQDLKDIFIEPNEDGHAIEQDTHGHEREWGRVLDIEPPNRIVFSWQIAPDRSFQPDLARSSEVEVRFVAEGPSRTRVELEHRSFDRYEDAADWYREGLSGAWTELLDAYAAAVDAG